MSKINIPYPITFSLPNFEYLFRRCQRRPHNSRKQEEIRFPPVALRNPVPSVPKYPGKRSSRELAFHALRTGTIGPRQDLLQRETGGQ